MSEIQKVPQNELEAIAKNFSNDFDGKLPQFILDNTISDLKRIGSTKYPAQGSVGSFFFYLRFNVEVKKPGDGSYRGGKFKGDAGGFSSAGGGALYGDVYTDDLERLYRDTRSFSFAGTLAYMGVYFYSSNNTLLGTFQSGAVSTVIGTGAGSGKWSDIK